MDTTAQLAQILPGLALALYETAPHGISAAHSEEAQLTPTQRRAVIHLAHNGPLTMSELATGLGIGRAAASELVARLVAQGVAKRDADAVDRRIVLVSLAGPAATYVEEVLTYWGELLTDAFAHHPTIDPDDLVAFLQTLTAKLKEAPGKP